jgi:acyl carrier protein
MTRDEIRTAVVQALSSVAPEIDAEALSADTLLRQDLDLDSMDFLNFVIALHERLGVEIPERDYLKLGTIEGAVRYIEGQATASLPRRSPPSS